MKLNYHQAKELGLTELWPSQLDSVVPDVGPRNQKENKWHQEFRGVLASGPFRDIESESIKLRLAGKTWYTPDFVATRLPDHAIWAFEVKGFMRDDAAVKVKVAASQYPWIVWVLATRSKSGAWLCRFVTPESGIQRKVWTPSW